MEKYALINRPELRKSHYDEKISIQETKATMSSLLPGLNFNAAWTHSSNDHLMNKTNLEYGTVMGANLLNVFMYPKIKRINETNTEVIREKRLALSMAVLSQVHLSNIDYSLALEEYDTAERYYQVSKKITEQVKNAQKIARFGNLELIREKASLLVAELRYDIAYSKLQHAIGKIYTSVGIDITRENVKSINFKDYASIIKNNFKVSGKRYYAEIRKPIKNQNPIVKKNGEGRTSQFSFAENTFKLDGEGRTTYDAFLSNDKPLPSWITFLPSQKTFLINNLDKDNTEELKIKVIAKNIDTRIEDTFTLMVDPELRATRLKNEKRLEEQRKLAKKRKQEEIERLKAEKILKEKQAKEEELELARKQAEETLRQEQEKIQLEKQQQEELLAKQKAEEKRLIEEQKELLAKQKAEEQRLIEEQKQKELLAKQEAEEFRIKQAEQLKEVLVAQRRQLYFNLPGNAAKEVQTTSYSTERDDLSKDLLNELKSIETKINDIMLNLDLDKRLDLTKNIVQDIFKSNAFQKKEVDPKYDNLNFQINNQRKMLEELLKYSNKYTSY